ncbi:octanoyl-[acyl-carrier-protein]:protein N-octanoyltransferase LIPT2, mitochondrial [Petromyzon marinus]|uniref:octanoyl-[acyl-carrier-protein]:protein N-octanoyltransferase LIPT2, mitochondrial n=1 Tax=Petromyzon marinus TaxID=7757 RepID=UPI003F712CCE
MAAAVAAGRVVRVVSLGRVGYAQALAVQTRLARALLDHLAAPSGPAPPDTLLLCEHDPVYTVGIRQAPYPAEVETRLRALGADFHRTNRGGLITFHGPGQLVCYPVLHLARHRRSLRWYVCQLERVAADACRDLGVPAHSHEQHTGVWVGERKICAIGIHCARFVTWHGLALNCDCDLRWFEHVVPCGLEGLGVTSLTRELDRRVAIPEAETPLLRAFARHFQCELVPGSLDLPSDEPQPQH